VTMRAVHRHPRTQRPLFGMGAHQERHVRMRRSGRQAAIRRRPRRLDQPRLAVRRRVPPVKGPLS
jgi:hypothetical protein